MNFLFSGKAAFPLLIAALLLLQPFTMTPFSPAPGSEGIASRHRCGCAVEEAASGACGCAARRCCTCCPGPGEETAPGCHPPPREPAAIYFRVFSCGGPEDFSIHASGIKVILTDFIYAFAMSSALFPENTHKRPENLSLQPSVPPPEIADPSLTALI